MSTKMKRHWWQPKYGIHGVDGDIMFYTRGGREQLSDLCDTLSHLCGEPKWARDAWFDKP